MNPDEMNLEQVIKRLAELDVEVKAASDAAAVEALAAEKKTLLERKASLEALEARKQTALDITNGIAPVSVVEAKKATEPTDIYNTPEYRKAFMDFCQRGTDMPVEYRLDAFAAAADVAAVIPTTTMNEIIVEMKKYGQLYDRVRKTNIAGGVRVPIMTLKPVAARITEAAPSDRKKVTASTYVSFSYIGLECKIATSLIASATSLPVFESTLVPLIVEAMVKQMEIEIIKGNGTTEMLGVTVDTRVAAGQTVTLSSTDVVDWEQWKKKVFAKIPLAYRAGSVFVMSAGTFDGYIDGMTDAGGQPIGRVTYGITEGTLSRFGGKEVIQVEEDVIDSYDSASVGDVIAVVMNPTDYAINSNMQMGMYRWLDQDLNQWVDKAILINDGKPLDVGGILIIKKGA